MSKEKQLWDEYGAKQKGIPFVFGEHYSYQFRNTPRHILFTLSRYKFAAKMIGEGKVILELGCNEGLGSHYLSEFATHVHGVDFDEEAITWAKENLENEKLTFQCDDFLNKKYGQNHAVVSYDVIEHISPEHEDGFLKTVTKNLVDDGIFLVGTPNITSHQFSNPELSGAHINLYSGQRLCTALERYFHNVFLFSMNDEMIHTGFVPMAHYLVALCCSKKQGSRYGR
jgi:2-polyprenyl-3-methyl-5-hydroxy-6-metoxy-1,4-benzoquinol methylase